MRPSALRRCDQACMSYAHALNETAQVAPSETALSSDKNTFFTFDRSILLVIYLLSKVYRNSKLFLLVSDGEIERLCLDLSITLSQNIRLVAPEDAPSIASDII